jgi:hypothetical protein
MVKFRLLFVDNDDNDIEKAWSVVREIGLEFIEPFIVQTAEEAAKIITNHTLHLAIVDLQLREGDGLRLGRTILGRLRSEQPNCERVVRSRMLAGDVGLIRDLFSPMSPLATSFLEKVDPGSLLKRMVTDREQKWRGGEVTIDGLDAIMTFDVIKQLVGDQSLTRVTEELNYLVNQVCGQGRISHDRSVYGPITIGEWRLLPGGASRAVVVAARPPIGNEIGGAWLVFKFDRLADIEQEYQRFQHFVRFHITRNRRTEVLGVSFGNSCGCICYAFAGKSPDDIGLLRHKIVSDEGVVEKALDALFHPSQKDLHRIRTVDQPLFDYLSKRYDHNLKPTEAPRYDPTEVMGVAAKTFDKFATWARTNPSEKMKDVVVRAGKLECMGTSLSIPNDLFESARFTSPMPCCIIHGDLHCGNVVTADDGSVVLIDYKDCGAGPRCLDFAAMETSIRVETSAQSSPEEIMKCIKRDLVSWKAAWSFEHIGDLMPTDIPGFPTDLAADKCAYWSSRIIYNLRRTFPDVSPQEYASTILAWCSHIVRVPAFSTAQRIRLIGWMSMLKQFVR